MQEPTSIDASLDCTIVNQVEDIILEAKADGKPLEIDPYRDQLFELFVTAEAAGFLEEDADPDLTADGLCRTLSQRWGLAEATRESFEHQTKLEPHDLSKLRMLWSLMRIWMEWTYAWNRWPEFHDQNNHAET